MKKVCFTECFHLQTKSSIVTLTFCLSSLAVREIAMPLMNTRVFRKNSVHRFMPLKTATSFNVVLLTLFVEAVSLDEAVNLMVLFLSSA